MKYVRRATWIGVCAATLLACAGADEALPKQRGSSKKPPASDPGAAGDCVITREMPLGEGQPSHFDHIRLRYDVPTSVLTKEWARDSDFREIHLSQRMLLDSRARMLVTTAVDSFNHSSWRFDRTLDAEGNVLESLATYTDDLEFAHAPVPPHYSLRRYEHVYDDRGRLHTTRTLESESGWTFFDWSFETDDEGRCASVSAHGDEIGSSLETFVYDGNTLIGTRRELDRDGIENTIETALRYDDQARIETFEQDGDEHAHSSADGLPDIVRSYDYAADGGVEITLLDFTSDTPNATIERNGEETWATRVTWNLSAECSELSARIQSAREVQCQFLAPLVSDLIDR